WKDLCLLCVHMLWRSNTPCHSQPSSPVPICKLTLLGVCYKPCVQAVPEPCPSHTDFKMKMPDATELALHASQKTSLPNGLQIMYKCRQRADIRD
ncbi:mCG1046201, partial [Mus musculus]